MYETYTADMTLCSIDCGFDSRRHPEIVCAVPIATRSVAYDLDGQATIARGTIAEILATLRAAGYRVRLVD
jgi:hypothetical protein